MSDFKTNVILFIKRVPKGKVVSYGQVAAAAGSPRAARQVGGILRSLDIAYRGPQISGYIIPKGNLGRGASLRRRRAKKLLPAEAAESIDPIPWWRVINNAGVISIKGNWTATKELQAELLEKDGVKIGKDFTIDMTKYRY